MTDLILRVESDPAVIRALVAEGYCPVECSAGGESIVDSLVMDHHGENSSLEGVAIRAYRDHFGARADDPRFVTCHPPDADACFATAALAGVLPHPDRVVPSFLPPVVKKVLTTSWGELAATINLVDCDPIGINVGELPFGSHLLAWQSALSPTPGSALDYYGGVALWKGLLTGVESKVGPLTRGVHAGEHARRGEANRALGNNVAFSNDGVLGLADTTAWGFDVWYSRRIDTPADQVEAWAFPCVLALAAQDREITIGCPNVAVAEKLFGPGGLKNVFPKLDEISKGWGGRESIGGSPRETPITSEQFGAACRAVADAVVAEVAS